VQVVKDPLGSSARLRRRSRSPDACSSTSCRTRTSESRSASATRPSASTCARRSIRSSAGRNRRLHRAHRRGGCARRRAHRRHRIPRHALKQDPAAAHTAAPQAPLPGPVARHRACCGPGVEHHRADHRDSRETFAKVQEFAERYTRGALILEHYRRAAALRPLRRRGREIQRRWRAA
jgi:hypothetical protein